MHALAVDILARLTCRRDGMLAFRELQAAQPDLELALSQLDALQLIGISREAVTLKCGGSAFGQILQANLHTAALGRPLLQLASIGSTNSLAAALAAAGGAVGCVVVADKQTQGRGRLQRVWHSPPARNLYVSAILAPARPLQYVSQLALVAAVATAKAIRVLLPELPVQLKWPNDLWLGNRKLAGILCQGQAATTPERIRVIVGLGVNVNLSQAELPAQLADTATSLAIASGQPQCRAQLLALLLNALETEVASWQAHGLTPLLPFWHEHSLLYGKHVSVSVSGHPLSGCVRGIDAHGALRLQLADGREQPIHAGDVHVTAVPPNF